MLFSLKIFFLQFLSDSIKSNTIILIKTLAIKTYNKKVFIPYQGIDKALKCYMKVVQVHFSLLLSLSLTTELIVHSYNKNIKISRLIFHREWHPSGKTISTS